VLVKSIAGSIPRPKKGSLTPIFPDQYFPDEENCDIPSVKDHRFFEEHKTEYHDWKMKRMGEQPFNLLMVRAHTPGRRDDTPILRWLKQEMKKQ